MGPRVEFSKTFCTTPLGLLEITGKGGRIARARFVRAARLTAAAPAALKKFAAQIRRYFRGGREVFSVPCSPEGTRFQKKVWREISKIPFGRTATYTDIARRVGRPRAVRAVGGAAGQNPILIAIPCHRVIAHGGKLSGFACGVRRKAWLLSHERR